MGGTIKKYFKKEFQLKMFSLDYEDSSDFYLSCWQSNRAIWPLLMVRTLILIGFLSTVVASFVIMVQDEINVGYWFIFMTRWGLLLNTVSSLLAWSVSITVLLKGPDSTPPALIKLYWISYNTAITIAFLITIFYYSLLTEVAFEAEFEVDPVLDLFLHGINSVQMFVLLITSRHSHRLLHVYFPIVFALIYMVFSIIYYFAGGMSPLGTHWIYPMLDWSKPGEAVLLVVVIVIVLIAIHLVVVAMTLCRDALSKRCRDTTPILTSGEHNTGVTSNDLR